MENTSGGIPIRTAKRDDEPTRHFRPRRTAAVERGPVLYEIMKLRSTGQVMSLPAAIQWGVESADRGT